MKQKKKYMKWNYCEILWNPHNLFHVCYVCKCIQCRLEPLCSFSTACTLILEFYCMGTKLIVKPPDQRRRQVEVSLYSKWYFLRPEVGVLAKSFKLTFNRPFYFMRKNYHLYKKTINLWLRLCYDVRKKGFLNKISVCRRYFYRLRSV